MYSVIIFFLKKKIYSHICTHPPVISLRCLLFMVAVGRKSGATMATVDRLQLTLNHIQPEQLPPPQPQVDLSIVHGPAESPLWEMTLGELLEHQSRFHTHDECLVVPWTSTRWTYGQLRSESDKVARGLIAQGVRLGDRIGIMAGNCEQYISLFFAAASVGAILVVINNNYTLTELVYALRHTGMYYVYVGTRMAFFFFFFCLSL